MVGWALDVSVSYLLSYAEACSTLNSVVAAVGVCIPWPDESSCLSIAVGSSCSSASPLPVVSTVGAIEGSVGAIVSGVSRADGGRRSTNEGRLYEISKPVESSAALYARQPPLLRPPLLAFLRSPPPNARGRSSSHLPTVWVVLLGNHVFSCVRGPC